MTIPHKRQHVYLHIENERLTVHVLIMFIHFENFPEAVKQNRESLVLIDVNTISFSPFNLPL